MVKNIFNKKPRLIIGLISFIALALLVFIVVASLKQRQEIRKKAAVPSGVATFSLNPQIITATVGQSLPVTIKFQSPSTPGNIGITGIQAVLSYTFTGENPLTINAENIQTKLISPWSYVFKQVNTTGNTTTISITAVYMSGGNAGYIDVINPTDFVTLNFNAVHEGSVHLTFSSVDSKIKAKLDNSDILSDNLPTGTYTIGAAATNTPIPPTNTPVPTMAPTDRCRLEVVGGTNHHIGETVRIKVTQNPKCANRECYYANLDVNLEGTSQKACTASGFSPSSRIIECGWNTLGMAAANYTLKTTYGGHGDPTATCPGNQGNPDICCCDGGYDCRANVILSTPPTLTPTPTVTLTPTPTATITPTPAGGATGTPTPTVTLAPGQVKIQFKIKFAGVETDKPKQIVKFYIHASTNVRQRSHRQDVELTSVQVNNKWIYQSSLITLPANVTSDYQSSTYYLIYLKGPKHLQTMFCKKTGQIRPCNPHTTNWITLENGENELDFTGYPLPGGDLPLPEIGQDGVANSLDAVYLTNCMRDDDTGTVCLNKADLNFDKIINSQDQEILNKSIYSRWEDDILYE